MFEVLAAILGISWLVIVHEAGHYWMARRAGIRVTHFSLGFGPVLAKYRSKRGTIFQVCAVPFLGYVRIAGMNPAEPIPPNDPTLYANKSLFARALTVAGGPLANYLAATLLVFGLALSGWRESKPIEPMLVETVLPGSPAEAAGVRAGDVIVEVHGQKVRNITELSAVTNPRAGLPTSYVIVRNGERLAPIEIVPRKAGSRGVIGVNAKLESVYRPLPLLDATRLALALPWVLTVQNVVGFSDMITQRSTEGLVGPIGMGKLVAQQAEKGFYDFIGILIAISVALGFFNLLPLPFLDGGRLVFLAYELVTRRKPNQRVEMVVHAAGMLALLTLVALITLRDVIS